MKNIEKPACFKTRAIKYDHTFKKKSGTRFIIYERRKEQNCAGQNGGVTYRAPFSLAQ